jgi:hypothetical protein
MLRMKIDLLVGCEVMGKFGQKRYFTDSAVVLVNWVFIIINRFSVAIFSGFCLSIQMPLVDHQDSNRPCKSNKRSVFHIINSINRQYVWLFSSYFIDPTTTYLVRVTRQLINNFLLFNAPYFQCRVFWATSNQPRVARPRNLVNFSDMSSERSQIPIHTIRLIYA